MNPRFARRFLMLLAIVIFFSVGAAAWNLRPRATPDQLFAGGLAAADRGDWPEVFRSAERLKLHTNHADEEHLLRSMYLIKTNQPATALQELGRLKPAGALRESALLTAGDAMYQLGRLSEAERLFATLASEHPGHLDAHRWLAAIAYDLGDMNRALDETSIVIRRAPTDYRPHLLQAQIHADLEHPRAAVEAYSHAVARHPPEGILQEILPELARAQMRSRDYAAASQTLAKARQSAVTLALEAECLLSLGDELSARARLEEARTRDPQEPTTLRLLGRMELDAGRPEAALEPLRAIVEQDPQDHESRHHLAQALRLAGKTREADAEARRAAHLIELKMRLSKLTGEAIDHPQDSDVRDRMAVICNELGKTQLAASWRKAAAACRQRKRIDNPMTQ